MGSIPRPTYRSSYRGSPIIRSLGSTNFCPGTSVYRTPLPPPKLLNHSVRNLHLRTPLRRLSLSPTRVNSVPTGRLLLICREGLLICREGLLICREGLLICREGLLICREGLLICREGLLICREGLLIRREGLVSR